MNSRTAPSDELPAVPHRPAVASRGTRLARNSAAVGQARQYLKGVLVDLTLPEGLIDDALLVASELVSNAIKHGWKGDVRLLVAWAEPALTLTVADRSPYTPLPVVEPADDSAEHGRGLVLVDGLAETWGHRPVGGDPASGTAVWARLVADGGAETCRKPSS